MEKQNLIIKEFQNVNFEEKIHMYLKFPELRELFCEIEKYDSPDYTKPENLSIQ